MSSPYRYTTPVPKKMGSGQVAGVYAQMAEDFILADGPLLSLSPVPDLLAATWALLREAQLSGRAPRVDREIVATAVSQVNRCQFCTGAHTVLLHATGDDRLAEAIWKGETPEDPVHAAVAAWARATATHGAAELIDPPFPAPLGMEYVGTALVTHFINRMTSALLDEDALAGRLQRSALIRRIAGRAYARIVRGAPAPGASLALLTGLPAAGDTPAWGEGTSIGFAYATLRAAAARGGQLLGPPARDLVVTTIAGWDGAHPPLGTAWLDGPVAGLYGADRPGARLALLAALAPHRITDADVAAWRAHHGGDAELIRLLAFGAMSAVDRIGDWTTAGLAASSRVAVTR